MTGRNEVNRLKQRLDATFKRVKGVGQDAELQADFSKYLCVLVSGYLEKAVFTLVVDHARKVGAPSLQRFVHQRTKNFANAKSQKLINLLGDFDQGWRISLEGILVDDLKDAVDSVVNLRNTIAHGDSVGVTYQTVVDYYLRVQNVVDHIANLCD
jgi:hypothetical protein